MNPASGIRTAALLTAPVLVACLGGAGGVFQFDDFNVIVDNPVVHSFGAWWADAGHGIRPLLKLSYTANWVAGPGVAGFHAVNIGVHLVNTLFVYLLARLLAQQSRALDDGQTDAAALIAALCFGLHPANTEAVAYVSGRSSSLMAAFFLGSVIAHATGSLRGQRRLTWLVSPLLFALALLTKESAISLPIALLLWEASRGQAIKLKDTAARLSVHALVLALATAALLLHPVYGERLVPDLGAAAVAGNLLTQIDALAYFGARVFVVWPLNIDPDLRAFTAWSPALAAKAALLGGVLVLGALALRRRPWWGFGLLWFFAVLLPTNSLLPRLDIANDRQLYLASVGLFSAIGIEIALVCRRLPRARRRIEAATIAVLALLGVLAFQRGLDYTSEVRLWQQTARVSPLKPRVFNNLGFAYSAAGCLREAEAAYREALRLKPDYPRAQANLERLLERAGPSGATCPP